MLKLFVAIQNKLAEVRSEEGQTMAEYGVVLAVITAGIIVALTGTLRWYQWRPRFRHRDAEVRTRRNGAMNTMVTMSWNITTQSERGQTMAEYSVVLGVITLAIVFSFAVLSGAIEGVLNDIVELLGSVL